jgi:type IV secretory pathway VirB3-like protein
LLSHFEERFAMIGPLGCEQKTRRAARRWITLFATLIVLIALFLGCGCASYHRYRPTPEEYSGISREGKDLGDMTDAAVVAYADRVRDTLRKRFHIARITRQSSSTAQVLLAGVAGIAAAFTAGATVVVSLAAGSVAMPQVAEIFDAGSRAVAYQQAVAKISAAENAYFRARAGRPPVVPKDVLTIDGALLYEAINGATDAVELFQAGMLPTLEQMQRAEAIELQRRAALPRKTPGVVRQKIPPRIEPGNLTTSGERILESLGDQVAVMRRDKDSNRAQQILAKRGFQANEREAIEVLGNNLVKIESDNEARAWKRAFDAVPTVSFKPESEGDLPQKEPGVERPSVPPSAPE